MGLTVNAILAFGVAFEGEDLPDALAFLAEPEFNFDDWIAEAAGLPEWSGEMTEAENDRYWERKRRIVEACPVEHELHTEFGDEAGHILAVRGSLITAYWGRPVNLDLDLIVPPEDAVRAFRDWCARHGVPIDGDDPRWIMASVYAW